MRERLSRQVIRSLSPERVGSIMVNADMDVREIMEQFGRGDEPIVGVLDGDKLIGQISTDRILAKLVDPRG